MHSSSRQLRPWLAPLALLALLTLGEIRLGARLFAVERADADFVALSVNGVLDGHPVSKSWQHRLLGPALVAGCARFTHDGATAFAAVAGALTLAANLLLFGLKRGEGPRAALIRVALFGLAHALTAYRLEYAWDGIDIILFFIFGHWAARGGGLPSLWPLLLVGTMSHETILYLPLWYLLAPLEPTSGDERKREPIVAAAVAAMMGMSILYVRQLLYRGRPSGLPDSAFEQAMPVVGNHFHLAHNLSMLCFGNWVSGRAFVSAALFAAIAWLGWCCKARRHVRAAAWSLIVIASIGCFGYFNETRHYLPLLAFWFAYL